MICDESVSLHGRRTVSSDALSDTGKREWLCLHSWLRSGPHPQALLADARPASGRLLLSGNGMAKSALLLIIPLLLTSRRAGGPLRSKTDPLSCCVARDAGRACA